MNADRVLEDLRELARLTGGPDGARRVCWTDEWTRAREFLRSRLDELPVEVSVDAAGNLWADLPGQGEGFVIVGSHVDSVPAGGWLDGALGVFAAVEAAAQPGPPRATAPASALSTGPTRRVRASGAACSAPRPAPAPWRSTRCATCGPRGRAPRGRGRPLRRGPRARARVGRPAHPRLCLPRAAHRAGARAREPRRARRDRARHLRGGASRGRVHRRDRSRRRHADGAAARQLRRHRAGGAGHPRGRLSPRRRLHGGRSHQPARSGNGDRRSHGDAARPASSRSGRAGRHARRGPGGVRPGRRRPGLRGGARATSGRFRRSPSTTG